MDVTERCCDNCGESPAHRVRYDWGSDSYDHSVHEETIDLCMECLAAAINSVTAQKKTCDALTAWVSTHRKYLSQNEFTSSRQRDGR